MKYKKISVIIPTFNVEKFISSCLSSLEKLNYPKKKYEVIIVDDGSTDQTLSKLKDKKVKILRLNHKGPAEARNKGAVIAKGEILLFIDADTIIPRNLLIKINKEFFRDSQLEGLGGLDKPLKKDYYLGKCIRLQENFFRTKLFMFKKEVLKYKSCLLAIRSKKFNEIKGFNTKKEYYGGEDLDIVERLNNESKIKFFDNIFLYHNSGRLKEFVKKNFISLKSINQNYYGKNSFIHYIIGILLILSIIFLLINPKTVYVLFGLILITLFLFASVVSLTEGKKIDYAGGIWIIFFLRIIFILIPLGQIFKKREFKWA